MEQDEKPNEQQEENVTMTKTEYQKAIQSAEDKLRTNYSKQIKGLEDKIKELTPTEKTDAELDFENRSKALEAKEKKIALLESLTAKNIDKAFADYLKDDVDIDGFNAFYQKIMNTEIESTGFKPSGHNNNFQMSKEKWKSMSYHEKQEFYNSNPELAKKFMQ